MIFTTLLAYCNKISITHESNAITWDTPTWKQQQNTETHTVTHTHTHLYSAYNSLSSQMHNKTQRTHKMWQGCKVNEVREALHSSSLPSALLLRLSLLKILSILVYLLFFRIPVWRFLNVCNVLTRRNVLSTLKTNFRLKTETEVCPEQSRGRGSARAEQSRAARQQTWLEFGSNCLCMCELECTTVAAASLWLVRSLSLSLPRSLCALLYQPWPRAVCLLLSPSFACLLSLFWAQCAFGGISNLSAYRNMKLGLGVCVLAKGALIGRAHSNYGCCSCVAHVLIRRRHWAIMFVVVVMHLVQIAGYFWAQCTVQKGL